MHFFLFSLNPRMHFFPAHAFGGQYTPYLTTETTRRKYKCSLYVLFEILLNGNFSYLCNSYFHPWLKYKNSALFETLLHTCTAVPTKSDIYVIFCLQNLSKTLTFTLHLCLRKSIDHLFINPILRIG